MRFEEDLPSSDYHLSCSIVIALLRKPSTSMADLSCLEFYSSEKISTIYGGGLLFSRSSTFFLWMSTICGARFILPLVSH